MAEKKHPEHTMLYRPREDGAKNPEAWNLPLDTQIVESAEVDLHRPDGWLTAAEVHAAPDGETKTRGRRGKAAE
jgi:hypothetical protein